MTDRSVAGVRPHGDPPVRTRLYRALALVLAATRPPAGVVLEATVDDPVPWISVRPAALLGLLDGPLAAARAEVRPSPPAPPRPPARALDRSLLLAPAAGGGPASPLDRSLAADPASVARAVGSGGWCAVQTYWVRVPDGRIAVARRARWAPPDGRPADRDEAVATALARTWSEAIGRPALAVPVRRQVRAWDGARAGAIPPGAWTALAPPDAARTAEAPAEPPSDPPTPEAGHALVLGASGAGKTTYLARAAAAAIAAGEAVAVVDLHGDLAPAIVARLDPAARGRLVAVDAAERPVPGIAALPADGPDPERTAAHLVAALKRLTPDGTDLYWGFRLERIFDTFVRVAQEEGGSLVDVHHLLTSPERRESARLTTRRPELARFLDELAPVVRRNPEFLWSAATRVSKVVLVPALGELLAPRGDEVPVDRLLAAGRSVLVRLPFATLGPEAAAFAGTLVLGRIYLGLLGRPGDGRRALLVLDEVHAFSPRLVAEILTEGRKFGVRALVASQYPDRLPPELRSAAAGALTTYASFRVPPAVARETVQWLGLAGPEAERLVTELPTGSAVVRRGGCPEVRLEPGRPDPDPPSDAPWRAALARTRIDFPAPAEPDPDPGAEAADELLLLAVLGAEEEGRPLAPDAAVPAARQLPGARADPSTLADRWPRLRARSLVCDDGGRCRLTPAGERALGLGAPTGAARESAQHRALLLAAFRIFARRGYRLEIVRQGRFDTTLPDGFFGQVRPERRHDPPFAVAAALDAARGGWAWRAFHGRDVHVEAEVSGADRADRIRRDVAKARARGAFLVVVVGDARRAARVRATLGRSTVGPDRAQVWTLRTGLGGSDGSDQR
ncbi:MAG TPA: hypothetical protein VMG99_07640 [Thermoplasmata archaeon]|nr:hypothetical protein [Thermoplasmata archaeon]